MGVHFVKNFMKFMVTMTQKSASSKIVAALKSIGLYTMPNIAVILKVSQKSIHCHLNRVGHLNKLDMLLKR